MNEETYKIAMEKCSIPRYMRSAILRYLVHGIMPGDFLRSVISNDLTKAVGYADDQNIEHLKDYVLFFYNHTPGPCWGHSRSAEEWCQMVAESK